MATISQSAVLAMILGFKTSTLVSPQIIRKHIIPQYARIIDLIKQAGKPFMWHSCGKIFSVMDDVIALGINGKHSNEDAIAPFDEWITLYGDRIALLGGIDVDTLCNNSPNDIFDLIVEMGTRLSENGWWVRPRVWQFDPRLCTR